MQLKNGGWKLPLYASLQFALALLATVASLAVTLDSRDWLELACGDAGGASIGANSSLLAAGLRGLRAVPSWSGLAASCGAEFAARGRAESAAWTAVNWLLVAASVTASASLVLLVLGSSLARRRPPARWLPVAFLTFDLLCALLLSIAAVTSGISIIRLASLRPSASSAFPPQLAAVVAAAVASAAGAAALPLRRTLLASRAYDVALAAAAASSTTSSDAMTPVPTVTSVAAASAAATAASVESAAARKSWTLSSNASAYQSGECVDDCICEIVASAGVDADDGQCIVVGGGWDNCGMVDTTLHGY